MDRRRLLRLALTLPAALAALTASLPAGAADGKPPSPSAKPSAKAGRRPRLVVLDPGHGGADPGAVGTRGTLEKDVTLDIAREMARQLGQRQGVTVRLTRDDDRFLALEERVALARKADADLFLSIHADSAPNPQARGLSAYTLSDKASDAFASRLAQQENRADRFGGPKAGGGAQVVRDILLDLTARHTRNASLVARQRLVRGAGKELRLLDNPMRSANFAVLKAPDVPSVLVETGFLSNLQDEAILSDATARRVVARVLAREVAVILAGRSFG